MIILWNINGQQEVVWLINITVTDDVVKPALTMIYGMEE